jgi:hypothetical protein
MALLVGEYMNTSNSVSPVEPFPVLLSRTLAHDDVIAYADGARLKVISVIDHAATVICKAYQDFSEFPFDAAALDEITRNSKNFKFENFISQ